MSGGRWRDRAACLGTDAEAFFADRGDFATVRLAKRVCAGCEVRAECLADALAARELYYGVRGGLAPEERRELVRQARRAAAA